MAKKKYYLVLDSETLNSIEQPLCYDIGYAICDRQGKIYEERSFVVAETFLDMQDVMQSAYYANKIPEYWEDIKSGKRQVKGIWSIRKQLIADMDKYNISSVYAYNMAFDKRALNNTIRYVSKSWRRWFFPFGTEFHCIWNCACELLLARKTYIDFAIKNGLESEKGNLLSSAEACYKYITKKLDFEEEHKGLEDVRIEIAILTECFRQHKKMDTKINTSCWRKVQKKRKEIESRG
jgi:hypothetical protein